ncbi:NAD-dependent epimerase/dehydratase family protein [Methanoplanus limicola]|uniref:NAD-dependent epimerase/dehydratase n=1 Tax=Methanoplanus limicola DSM 2279 TaxID=937775 RepID=H1YXC9_9EURY|nr:NAD(P)-dependent oxidoreductase [Methanoplanus limicola]EHQ36866.1 NAD-dependent epimerase/dehydratase [Methanoplanus limicola DSM 2279]
MKALVTGGKGFLGRHIVNELLKQNIETVTYDIIEEQEENYSNNNRENNNDNNLLTYVKGDILDKSGLKKAMEGCDLVFHTAAIADINIVRNIPEKTMEINVLGTTRCLQAARECGVKRFLFASSVYSAGNHGSFYSVSKKAGESLCKTYYEEFGLEYTILRYGSLYGTEANHWNFIYGLCKQLLLTGKYTYTSSPDSLREYINILDASRESVRIAREQQFANTVVMLAGHQRMMVKELFKMIEEIIGKDISIKYEKTANNSHYVVTPYSYESDVPIRINLPTYVDISEGILECLKAVDKDLKGEKD